MPTVKFLRNVGDRNVGKATGIFRSVLAVSLIMALSAHVEAGSPVVQSADTLSPLPSQTAQLDQRLADVESRLQNLMTHEVAEVSTATHPTVDPSPIQIATGISTEQPSSMETDELSQTEIQRLEETVVRDTFLDPFSDEATTEIIPDPWEPMYGNVGSFNMGVDRYVLAPVATGYAWLVPDPVELAIGRMLTNIRFVPRTINDLLQWKWENAGIEVGRFVINSTVGVAGMFDVANDHFGIEPVPAEDFGQTLAMHGVQSGPYLVLPLLPPTTVRDGIGTVGDIFLDPLNYVLPFVPQASMRTTEIVHQRSQTLEVYEGVEVATLDMYSAVREAYSQKRSQAIRE